MISSIALGSETEGEWREAAGARRRARAGSHPGATFHGLTRAPERAFQPEALCHLPYRGQSRSGGGDGFLDTPQHRLRAQGGEVHALGLLRPRPRGPAAVHRSQDVQGMDGVVSPADPPACPKRKKENICIKNPATYSFHKRRTVGRRESREAPPLACGYTGHP